MLFVFSSFEFSSNAITVSFLFSTCYLDDCSHFFLLFFLHHLLPPEALKLNPSDAGLASRIGRALITTHDYARALRYYEAAVAAADPSRTALFHELIELYVKLSKYEEVCHA